MARIHTQMWRKAQRLIAGDARVAWLSANTRPNGGRYKKHRPYSLPQRAIDLVEALGADDPERVSGIILYEYTGR